MTTLVSFIGRPGKRIDSGGSSPAGAIGMAEYERTLYHFGEDGFSPPPAQFFGWAAFQHLRWKAGGQAGAAPAPSRWLVIGTPTSGWQMLSEVALAADEGALDAIASWSDRALQAVEGGGVSRGLLQEFERLLTHSLQAEVRLLAIEDELDVMFSCLNDNLEQGAPVVLDITHGFRTMSVHATLALGALRWIKGIGIQDILYGGLEKRVGRDAPSPAVSLAAGARLAEVTPFLADVALTGNLEAAADCAERLGIGTVEMREALAQAGILDSLLRVEETESVLRSKVISDEESWLAADGVGGQVGGFLRSSVGVDVPRARGDREFLRAQSFFDRRDYLRALLMLCESIHRRAIDHLGLETKLRKSAEDIEMRESFDALAAPASGLPFSQKDLAILRIVRNTVVHVNKPGPQVKKVLRDRAELHKLLKGVGRAARKSLFKHLS